MVLDDKVVLAGDPEDENQEEEEDEDEDDDDDMKDPHDDFKKECSKTQACVAFKEVLDQCNDRVNSRKQTEETCNQELFDYVVCVDKCAAPKVWKTLK